MRTAGDSLAGTATDFFGGMDGGKDGVGWKDNFMLGNALAPGISLDEGESDGEGRLESCEGISPDAEGLPTTFGVIDKEPPVGLLKTLEGLG